MAGKMLILAIILFVLLGMSSPAYCDTAIKKLGRGTCNVLTSPFEIAEQMKRVSNSDGPMAGFTYGLLKGIAMTGVRAVVGVYEIVTFPVPFPTDYQPILTDPEFFFEDTNW